MKSIVVKSIFNNVFNLQSKSLRNASFTSDLYWDLDKWDNIERIDRTIFNGILRFTFFVINKGVFWWCKEYVFLIALFNSSFVPL